MRNTKIGLEVTPYVGLFLQFQKYGDVVVMQVQLVEAYKMGWKGVTCSELKYRSQYLFTLLRNQYKAIIFLCQTAVSSEDKILEISL